MPEKSYPIIKIENEYWVRVNHDTITLRAESISKKNRVKETPSGHRFDQNNAKGSIKFKSKEFWINNFEPKKHQ